MAEKVLKMALIGVGNMGKKYAEMITSGRVSGMKLTAIVIRRPVVPVNDENVYVLQLLDLLKNLDMYLDESYDVAHDKVSQFVQIHGITKNDVDSYIREFPIAIFKYYYELRLDDVFA